MNTRNTIILSILISIALCVFVLQIRNWHNACSESGGEFVRTMNGTFKCAEVNK